MRDEYILIIISLMCHPSLLRTTFIFPDCRNIQITQKPERHLDNVGIAHITDNEDNVRVDTYLGNVKTCYTMTDPF